MRRRTAAAVLAAACAVLLSGCGIRPTEVPTEFGAAPSRVPCTRSASEVAARTAVELPVRVYLICGLQLVSVDRTVSVTDGRSPDDRVVLAQALLDELREPLSEPETKAGFTSDVESVITVRAPRDEDPSEALRLSTPPERLTPVALAQVICTLVNGVGAGSDSVVLGGTAPRAPLRAYTCTDEVRRQPGVAAVPSESVK